MKTTQIEWVHSRLQKRGYVTRNEALRNYISRLGAIVYNLRDMGFKVQGSYKRTPKGRDYVYKLVK